MAVRPEPANFVDRISPQWTTCSLMVTGLGVQRPIMSTASSKVQSPPIFQCSPRLNLSYRQGGPPYRATFAACTRSWMWSSSANNCCNA